MLFNLLNSTESDATLIHYVIIYVSLMRMPKTLSLFLELWVKRSRGSSLPKLFQTVLSQKDYRSCDGTVKCAKSNAVTKMDTNVTQIRNRIIVR